MYLSASTRQFFKRHDLFGCMFNTTVITGLQAEALLAGCRFMIDNGVYSNKWIERDWLIALIDFLPFRHNCLGCIVPDFLHYLPGGRVRGDWERTLERFYLYQPAVKRLGFPVAFATQDGQPIDKIPWSLLDTLFIGGSNYHKRGKEAEQIALEGKRLGKHVHVGRVSSVSAIKRLWPWADSWDGTTFRYEPDKREEEYIPQLEKFLASKDRLKELQYKLL